MTFKTGQLKPILTAVIQLLEIIPEIIKHYLAEKSEYPLYDVDELKQLLEDLKHHPEELKQTVQQAFKNYIYPLPVRPQVKELVHAQMQYSIVLKKYLNLTGNALILVRDQLFLSSLVETLEAQSIPDFSQLTAEIVDDLFEEFSANFRLFFIKHLKLKISELNASVSTEPMESKKLKPIITINHSMINCNDDSLSRRNTNGLIVETLDTVDSDGESIRETVITPTSLYREMSSPTPRLSETPTVWARNRLKKQKEDDANSDTELSELFNPSISS